MVTVTAAYTEYRSRDKVYTYHFEQWSNWSEEQIGTPPAQTDDTEVESYPVYRYTVNDMESTFYHYKRYRYENLQNGKVFYDYSAAYADSKGYPGEWEYDRTETEKTIAHYVDGGIKLYGGYGTDLWYASDVNGEGSQNEYITTESREDNRGETYDVEVELDAPGKKATVMVYHGTNVDPTNSQLAYIEQIILDGRGHYTFSFKPKFPVGQNGTGDFIVTASIEGGTGPITVGRIEALKPTYTVKFIEEDGTPIKIPGDEGEEPSDIQTVIEGHSAVLPPNPEKEGYRFIGWNTGVTNIRANTTITAVFAQKEYTVVFIDWDAEDFAMQTYKHGDPITVEDIPEQFGSVFAGWATLGDPDTVVESVTDNMVLTAKFDTAQYTATFYNKDGAVLNTQTVPFGQEAEPPAPLPPEDGRVFRFWSEDTDYITGSVEVFPVYDYEETAQIPVADVESGYYEQAQTVSLSTETEDADIYYVIVPFDEMGDGAVVDPFEYGEDGQVTNGMLYTEPVEVADAALYFVAAADGMNASDLGVAAYLIGEPGPGGVIYGDVNDDGEIDDTDAMLLSQYVNGWEVELGA